jgi:hypothetical protein
MTCGVFLLYLVRKEVSPNPTTLYTYSYILNLFRAIWTNGGAIPNCWAFIDGKVRSICRPRLNQEDDNV